MIHEHHLIMDVSKAVKAEDANDESLRIVWDDTPPRQVKCMADFSDQS